MGPDFFLVMQLNRYGQFLKGEHMMLRKESSDIIPVPERSVQVGKFCDIKISLIVKKVTLLLPL
ncbi:hypothetical protein [Arenibacter troitsensis]|uniref:hypothetical protein n=1 Tax=Arenibacter troitsensis TaxID=188872 RepID=UPI000A1C9D27|nr:hypothetical protein [Arenibacter troitsensis]